MPYKDQTSEAAKASRTRCNKRFYEKNQEAMCSRIRNWRKENPVLVKAQKHRHMVKYIDRELARIKAWKRENPERAQQAQRTYDGKHNIIRARQYKAEVIEAYGGCCVCCGESGEAFLTIDHIYGKGHAHKAKIGIRGTQFYRWLKKQGFPKDLYQLLCFNCNCAKSLRGKCPHEGVKFDVIGLAC